MEPQVSDLARALIIKALNRIVALSESIVCADNIDRHSIYYRIKDITHTITELEKELKL